jgi:cobalt-zinc-cadmium efflux system outer membrane protein
MNAHSDHPRRLHAPRRRHRATALAAVAMLLGCSVPFDHDRTYVAAEVERRSGQHLDAGPPAPSAVAEPTIPDGVRLEDGLTEDEAVAIALWNNAAFQDILAELGFSRSVLIQAGLLANPVLSVLFPLGPKQLEFAALLPIEAFWLRPKRVAAARLEAERVAAGLVQNGLDFIRDVKLAWVNAASARKRAELAAENARVAERIVTLTEARLRAGDVSEFEVMSTRIAALLAREEETRVGYEVEAAEAKLLSFLGVPTIDAHIALEESPSVSLPELDPALLVENALVARPDVRAAELAIEAARERKRLADLEFFTVSGGVDANEKGKKGFEIGPAMALAIPVFDRNQGGAARAEADVTRSLYRYASLRNTVTLEVRQACARLRSAQQQAGIWTAGSVPRLQDTIGKAEKAYASGDVAVLLLLQGTEQLLTVRARQLEAKAEIARASAELERSVGYRLAAAVGRPEAPPQ